MFFKETLYILIQFDSVTFSYGTVGAFADEMTLFSNKKYCRPFKRSQRYGAAYWWLLYALLCLSTY